jgi:flagella basal body P-ring formation protein FlgA
MYKYRIIPIMLLFNLFLGSNLFAESSFSGSRLKESLFNYIRSQSINEVEIMLSKDIPDFKFEQSDIIAKFTGNSKSLRGNCCVGIEFYSNDVLLKRIEIPLKIKIYSKVPVACNSLIKGKIISINDVSCEKKDITIYNDNEMLPIDSVIDKSVTANISKGTILIRRMIQSGRVINRGERVTIKSISGAVCITLKGTALQQAEVGQKVRVKSEAGTSKSAQIFEGIVSDDGSVILQN